MNLACSLRIIDFTKGSADIDVTDEDAILDINGVGLSAQGNWAYDLKVLLWVLQISSHLNWLFKFISDFTLCPEYSPRIPIRGSGQFDLKATGIDLKLGITLGQSHCFLDLLPIIPFLKSSLCLRIKEWTVQGNWPLGPHNVMVTLRTWKLYSKEVPAGFTTSSAKSLQTPSANSSML